MANINDRFFGAPLSGSVRVELERRQRQIGEIEFGDSIEKIIKEESNSVAVAISITSLVD